MGPYNVLARYWINCARMSCVMARLAVGKRMIYGGGHEKYSWVQEPA